VKKNNFWGSLVLLIIVIWLFPGFLLSGPDQAKLQKELAKFPNPNLTPALKATMRTTAGQGCCWNPSDPSPLEAIIVAFFDTDIIELKNFGLLAAKKGTLSVEWYDLYEKKMMNKSFDFLEVNPGESKILIFNPQYIIAKKSEGISIKIDYWDAANKSYHYQRKVTSCPDHF